jgi:hypothetical protein
VALDELATALIETEARSDTPFGLYVIRADDPFSELARSVEREVFYDYFGNTPDLLEAEYGPYEGASLFFVMIDHVRRMPAGVIRILLPSPAGFKSLHDITKDWGAPVDEVLERTGITLDLDSMWDIATLAVSRDYRGAATAGLVSFGLYQGATMLASLTDLANAVAIFDLVALDLVQKAIHRPFARFSGLEPQRYLDSSSSIPVYSDVREYRARLAIVDADMYEMLFAGIGMEAVISSPLHGIDAELDERWFQIA